MWSPQTLHLGQTGSDKDYKDKYELPMSGDVCLH